MFTRPASAPRGLDVASLNLTGMQLDLIKAVHTSGTPTVVVLVNCRPLSTPWIAENVPAIFELWLSGEQGGHAVAEVLSGDANCYNDRPPKACWMTRRHFVDMETTVKFELNPNDLALLDANLESVVEPGEFQVIVGHSSQDIRLEGSFEVHP